MKIKDFLSITAKGGAVVAIAVALRAIIGLGTQVAFARILAPEVFGQLAFATSAAMFLNGLANLRGDAYIIHEKESPHKTLDTIFTLELTVAIFLALFVWGLAPPLMAALGKSELTVFVQILSLSFLYNPFSRTRCLLERNFFFLRAKIPFAIAQLFGAITSITLALNGYGIWSLIWWRISVLFVEVVILWAITEYRPKLRINISICRRFLSYTSPLVASGLLTFFTYNVDYFIVGLFLEDGTTQLGFYWLGFQAAAYLLMVRQVLQSVLFPVFSRIDDVDLKKKIFLRFSRAVAGIFLSFTVFAVSFGRDIITTVYGSNWEPAVFPFQVLIIVVMMRAINSNNGYYLYSCGITKHDLTSAILSSSLLAPIAYFATIHFGINGAALSVLLVQFVVSLIIYEVYIRPMTDHGFLHFFGVPCFVAACSLVSAVIFWNLQLTIYVRLLTFAVLMLATYFLILRDVINDLKAARRITTA